MLSNQTVEESDAKAGGGGNKSDIRQIANDSIRCEYRKREELYRFFSIKIWEYTYQYVNTVKILLRINKEQSINL